MDWINNLSPERAHAVFGRHWREIAQMTSDVAQGHQPTRPDVLSPEDYEGSLFLYGPNGPSVYLFLRSWQELSRPENRCDRPAEPVVMVASRSGLPDPTSRQRWIEALLKSGAKNRGDTLANVWIAGKKTGLEAGNFVTQFIAPACAGELAQMPSVESNFFLNMMPWIRCGYLPCNWDEATDRLVVQSTDPRSDRPPEENLWPTHAIGMRVRDEEAVWRTAKETGAIIIIRDASPAMLQYIDKPGYAARPPGLPGYVRQDPPHVGLIAAAENQPVPAGFSVDAEPGRLIRDSAANAFIEGYELMGVYRLEDGVNAYTEGIRRELNLRLGAELIRRGPYETLAMIEDSRRPKPPVTAFFPDRAPVRLLTTEEMKGVYEAFSIDWDEIYPEDTSAGGPA